MKPKTWTHPKFLALSARVGGFVPAAGALEWIWHLGATFDEETGRMVSREPEVVFPPQSGVDPSALQHLMDCGWVDERDGALWIHDWEDHCPTYIQDRVRKRKQREVSRNVRDCPGHSGTFRDCPGHSGNGDPSASASASASEADQLTSADRKFSSRRRVTEAEVAQSARAIFQALNYRGADGRWLWKAGALLYTGILSEGDVMGLARASRGKKQPLRYFWTALGRNLKEDGLDINKLCDQITIEPDWPTIYPGD